MKTKARIQFGESTAAYCFFRRFKTDFDEKIIIIC